MAGSKRTGEERTKEEWEEDWDSRKRSGRTRSGQGQSGKTGRARSGREQSGKAEAGQEQSGRTKSERKKSGRARSGREQSPKRGGGLKKFLLVVVILLAAAGAGLYWAVGSAYGRMNYREIASVADSPMEQDGVINILLIGNDSRENGADGRSDAMILLSVSPKTKGIYMTSLLRDMYVDIPGYEGNRLNAAYSFGGPELLMKTVEQNLGISVNRYVLVNFQAFANLVDAVGGVELELSQQEVEYVNGYLVEYNMLLDRPQGTDNMDTSVSGLVHLNGAQALAYSRNRYIGTDFGRTERQRKVLTAVIGKLPKAVLTNWNGLMDGLMANLTTNLTRAECTRLGFMAGRLLTYEISSDSVPQPGTYQNATIRKMDVLKVDFEANSRYLKNKLYGE